MGGWTTVASAYLLVFVVTCSVTAGLTPVVRWGALRWGVLKEANDRDVHATATPNIGGIAMIGGVLAGLCYSWLSGDFHDVFASSSGVAGVAAAAVVTFGVGIIDDLRKVRGDGVSAPAKVAGLVLAGGVLSLAGVSTIFFRFPFLGVLSLPPDLATFITVMWVVGMANAINIIDGLDGLAAGVTGIGAAAFFLYSFQLDRVGVLAPGNLGPLVAIVVVGICAGFLPWNHHPAKIFMGDSGALLLGVLMAASTMAVGGSTDALYTGQAFFFFAPLIIPLVILGVPIFDTAFAIVRRASSRSGVASADKEHLHHRLMRLGHGHRRSVLILWTWTALLSAIVLVPAYQQRNYLFVPVGVAMAALLLFTVLHPGWRGRSRSASAPASDPSHAASTSDGRTGSPGPDDGPAMARDVPAPRADGEHRPRWRHS